MTTTQEYIEDLYQELEGRQEEKMSALQFWHRTTLDNIDSLVEFKEFLQEAASETDLLEYEGRNNIGWSEYSISESIRNSSYNSI